MTTTAPRFDNEPEIRYSDEWLAWSAEFDMRGPRNAAPYLMPIPFDQRLRAVGIAHTLMNLSPGWIYSSAVREAVALLESAGYAETYPERVAREYRETQRAESDARLLAAANTIARQTGAGR